MSILEAVSRGIWHITSSQSCHVAAWGGGMPVSLLSSSKEWSWTPKCWVTYKEYTPFFLPQSFFLEGTVPTVPIPQPTPHTHAHMATVPRAGRGSLQKLLDESARNHVKSKMLVQLPTLEAGVGVRG